jgi:hypothetical protein
MTPKNEIGRITRSLTGKYTVQRTTWHLASMVWHLASNTRRMVKVWDQQVTRFWSADMQHAKCRMKHNIVASTAEGLGQRTQPMCRTRLGLFFAGGGPPMPAIMPPKHVDLELPGFRSNAHARRSRKQQGVSSGSQSTNRRASWLVTTNLQIEGQTEGLVIANLPTEGQAGWLSQWRSTRGLKLLTWRGSCDAW